MNENNITYFDHHKNSENSDDILKIKNLINEYSKKSDYSNALKYSKLMIETYPLNIFGYYTIVKLMKHVNSFDNEFIEKIILRLVNFNEPIKQKK